jgi:Tfp pilus assembly protein PilZ
MNRMKNLIKKYDITIPKLFEAILKLNKEQQEKVLKYAESLLVENKRVSVRKACIIPLNYAVQNRIYLDHIKNISKSGLFIETGNPLLVGDEIFMSFNMQGYDRPLKIKGKIVHANQQGIGVEFKEISPYVAQMIEALIERMKGLPF